MLCICPGSSVSLLQTVGGAHLLGREVRVNVRFRTRRLQKEYEDGRAAAKSYGDQVGRKYIQRVNLIKSSKDFATLQSLPGLDCHPLKGDRKGQWAVKLTGFWRLIFVLVDAIPSLVSIEEVSKHYDD